MITTNTGVNFCKFSGLPVYHFCEVLSYKKWTLVVLTISAKDYHKYLSFLRSEPNYFTMFEMENPVRMYNYLRYANAECHIEMLQIQDSRKLEFQIAAI